MNAFAALNSLFDPARPCFTKEGVQTLLDLRAPAEEVAHMEALAEKLRQGLLGDEEKREYESWVRAGTMISMLQAKARLYMRKVAESQA